MNYNTLNCWTSFIRKRCTRGSFNKSNVHLWQYLVLRVRTLECYEEDTLVKVNDEEKQWDWRYLQSQRLHLVVSHKYNLAPQYVRCRIALLERPWRVLDTVHLCIHRPNRESVSTYICSLLRRLWMKWISHQSNEKRSQTWKDLSLWNVVQPERERLLLIVQTANSSNPYY